MIRRPLSPAGWFGVPALLLLALPFITLIGVTSWGEFHLAYGDWNAVAVSLGLSAVSVPLIIIAGHGRWRCGWLVSRHRCGAGPKCWC